MSASRSAIVITEVVSGTAASVCFKLSSHRPLSFWAIKRDFDFDRRPVRAQSRWSSSPNGTPLLLTLNTRSQQHPFGVFPSQVAESLGVWVMAIVQFRRVLNRQHNRISFNPIDRARPMCRENILGSNPRIRPEVIHPLQCRSIPTRQRHTRFWTRRQVFHNSHQASIAPHIPQIRSR